MSQDGVVTAEAGLDNAMTDAKGNFEGNLDLQRN